MRLCVSEKVSPQAKRARRETERVTVSTFVSESVEKILRTLCVCVSVCFRGIHFRGAAGVVRKPPKH